MNDYTKHIIFISGPYTAATPDGVEKNVAIAEAKKKELEELGFTVFCPHVHYHGNDHLGWDEIMQRCLPILRLCSGIFMLPNWVKSDGSRTEYRKAEDNGTPFFHDNEKLVEYFENRKFETTLFEFIPLINKLLPIDALFETVSTMAGKDGMKNGDTWRDKSIKYHLKKAQNHMTRYNEKTYTDPSSGLRTMAHIVMRCLMVCQLELDGSD